jgi:hypothetical protein
MDEMTSKPPMIISPIDISYFSPPNDSKFKTFVEVMLNIAVKKYEDLGMSYSMWLQSTTEGKVIMELLQSGDRLTRRYAGAFLVSYVISVYLTEGYDEQYFHKEMFSLLPVISQLIPNITASPALNSLMKKGIQTGVSKASSYAILHAFKKGIQSEMDIPNSYFDNWYQRAV